MRVSSNSQFILGVRNLQTKQFQLNNLNEQLSTFKRINRASDDPVAASSLVDMRQTQAINQQQVLNAQAAGSQLSVPESVLGRVSETIMTLKERTVQAGNTYLTSKDLQAIQGEVREKIKELVGLANSVDGNGNYVFGGTDKSKAPFTLIPPADISYVGNEQRQYVAISSSRQIAVTEPGSQVFGTTSQLPAPPATPPFTPGSELLQSLLTLDNALTAGTSSPTYTSDISNVLGGLDQGLANVSTARASIGSRMQEVDSMIELGQTMSVQYAEQISNLEDLDIPSAISRLDMTKAALEASQKTYSMIKGLSLFNYI